MAVGVETWFRSIGILGEYHNVIDGPTFAVFAASIIVFGIPVFLLGNHLFRNAGRSARHIRQSLWLYLIAGYCLVTWAATGLGNSEADGYLLTWAGISGVGIVTNYFCVVRRRRKTE